MLCRKSCYEIFTKYRSGAGSCIFKIARMYLFTDILKTHFILVFEKVFKQNQGNK